MSLLLLPADNGTWGVGIVASAADPAMRAVRHLDVWERVVASYPLAAHWLDGEPISDVAVMAKIEDRYRRYVDGDGPVATGVVAARRLVGVHEPVGRPRRVDRPAPRRVPARRAARGRARRSGVRRAVGRDHGRAVVEPLYRDTLAFDRHRLAEIDAQIAGVPYETDDPGWLLGQALGRGATRDPDLLRGLDCPSPRCSSAASTCWPGPGIVDKVLALDPGRCEPLPGPDRAEAAVDRRRLTTQLGGDRPGVRDDPRPRRIPPRWADGGQLMTAR